MQTRLESVVELDAQKQTGSPELVTALKLSLAKCNLKKEVETIPLDFCISVRTSVLIESDTALSN